MHAMMQFAVKPIQGAVMSNVQCARVRSNAAERKIRGSVHSVQVVHGVQSVMHSVQGCSVQSRADVVQQRVLCGAIELNSVRCN